MLKFAKNIKNISHGNRRYKSSDVIRFNNNQNEIIRSFLLFVGVFQS